MQILIYPGSSIRHQKPTRMSTTELTPTIRKLPADTHTPVGIYLRLRDIYPQSLLLECSDYSSRQDAFSFICLKPIAGIEANRHRITLRGICGKEEQHPLETLAATMDSFVNSFAVKGAPDEKLVPGLYGFTTYDAVNLFDNVAISRPAESDGALPLLRYDLYQLVIAYNHFNNVLYICELLPLGSEEQTTNIVSLLANRNTTTFPFAVKGSERSNITDHEFMEMVEEGRKHCSRGDVFQIVLSRRFQQDFTGDEFNVYRALRSINPSPYLFYFDYLSYKLFGSSPEAQLRVSAGRASINPIAGTVHRTGNPAEETALIKGLLEDPKENSEHCMLVDLARNDLSRHSVGVKVDTFREVHTYSHVIHLVSTVSGELIDKTSIYKLFADTFPAGTLTGAPKHRAIQLIDGIETTPRGFYGGAIGFIGLNGSLNHAIMIRSFLSRSGTLTYQAGAGVVIGSKPAGELNEVNAKISALRKAVVMANDF